MRGYAGRFVEVNLTTGETQDITFPDEVLRDYIGGRGLTAWLLWERLGDRWE